MNYRCPVCLYANLPYPPKDYHICPCCSTEFGNDDAEFTYGQLREMWIASGARWFFGNPPLYWNPWIQLLEAKHTDFFPKWVSEIKTVSSVRVTEDHIVLDDDLLKFESRTAA